MRNFVQAVFPRGIGRREVNSLLQESLDEVTADATANGTDEGRRVGPGWYAAAYGKLRSQRVAGIVEQVEKEGRSAALFTCVASDLASLEADAAAAALRQLEEIRAQGPGSANQLVIELLRNETANDARRALERIERHAIVLRVVPACIFLFVALSLPTVLASSLTTAVESSNSPAIGLLNIASDLAGFMSRALTPAFFGLLGALLGIAFSPRVGGSGAHWRMERTHERGARLCLGALIGCLISVTGPLFLGSGEDYTRLLMLSMVFGASQDTFYSRVLSRSNS
jgi:hypothetical protein